MQFLLSTTPPDAEALRNWLACLAFLLGILVAFKHLTKKETPPVPLPQPLRTEKAAVYVQIHEFSQLRQDHLNLALRVDKAHDDILRAGEDRAIKIHERLNVLINDAAESRGRLQALTDTLIERGPRGTLRPKS